MSTDTNRTCHTHGLSATPTPVILTSSVGTAT